MAWSDFAVGGASGERTELKVGLCACLIVSESRQRINLLPRAIMGEAYPLAVRYHQIPAREGLRGYNESVCWNNKADLGPCPFCEKNAAARGGGGNGASGALSSAPYPLKRKGLLPVYSFATKQFRWLYAPPSVYALMWPYIQAQGDEICFEVYKTGKNLQTKYEALYVSDGGLTLEEYNAIMRGAKDFVDVFSIEQLFDSREVVLKKAGGEKRGEGA